MKGIENFNPNEKISISIYMKGIGLHCDEFLKETQNLFLKENNKT